MELTGLLVLKFFFGKFKKKFPGKMNGNRGELTAEKLKAALISTTEDQLQGMVDFVCEQVKKSKEYPFFSVSQNLQFPKSAMNYSLTS